MATYKGIKGVKVVTKTSDPTASEATGTVWYNSTGDALKYSIEGAGSWASAPSLNTARSQASGIGIPSATLAVKGSMPDYTANSETFDGTAWTEGGNSNAASRNGRGTGTTTAAMTVGGWSSPGGVTATEYYDGTSWTIQTGTLTRGGGYQSFGSCGGSQASAMIFGGEPGTTYSKYSETWNGTSWSEGNNLNSLRQSPAGTGIVTAALCIGGWSPSVVTNVESYDGTSWTETSTDINTARAQLGGCGTSTLSLIYGGNTSNTATESFNGTTWTTIGSLTSGRKEAANAQSPANTNIAAMYIGGEPGYVATVEAYADPAYTIKTVTVS